MLHTTRTLRHIANAARRVALPLTFALAMPLLPSLASAADEHY